MAETLDPDIDAYGRYADASAMADWCEVHAAKTGHTREADLQDFLDDNDWSVRGDRLIHDAREPEDLDSRDSARSIFSILEERQQVLGAAYPFQVENGAIQPNLELEELASTPYFVLLAIAITHAWDLDAPENPRDVFEDTVARALEGWGFLTVNFGRIRRQGGATFDEHVVQAGETIDLTPTPERATRKLHAQDAGCDCIINFPWRDGRVDRWVGIGQVTCGESSSWEKKLDEMPLSQWRQYLGLVRDPRGYLAVPHHIEHRHFTHLHERNGRSLVDRLRLVKRPFEVSEAELSLTQYLSSLDVMELG